jgi:hypothetical protein
LGAIWEQLGSYPSCGQMVSGAGRYRISLHAVTDARAPHRGERPAPVEEMG